MFLSSFQKIVDGGIIFENKMPKRGRPPLEEDILQGTLDMLILRMLGAGPAHGHTIAHAIEHRSEQVLRVGKWLSLSGVASVGRPRLENNRKAKYYRLTPAGRKQLAEQTGRWEQLTGAIKRVLSPATE